MRVLDIAKVAALAAGCFLLVAAGMLLLQLRAASREVSLVAEQANQTVAEVRHRVVDTSQNTNAALIQLGLTLDEVRRAAMEQRQYWNKAGQETVRALQKTNDVLAQVQRTTSSVDESQRQVAAATVGALRSLPPAAQASTEAMQQAAADLRSLDKVISDQNIPLTLEHVNQTAAHLEATSESVDIAVKRMTKPKSLFRSLLFGTLDVAAKSAVIVK